MVIFPQYPNETKILHMASESQRSRSHHQFTAIMPCHPQSVLQNCCCMCFHLRSLGFLLSASDPLLPSPPGSFSVSWSQHAVLLPSHTLLCKVSCRLDFCLFFLLDYKLHEYMGGIYFIHSSTPRSRTTLAHWRPLVNNVFNKQINFQRPQPVLDTLRSLSKLMVLKQFL